MLTTDFGGGNGADAAVVVVAVAQFLSSGEVPASPTTVSGTPGDDVSWRKGA